MDLPGGFPGVGGYGKGAGEQGGLAGLFNVQAEGSGGVGGGQRHGDLGHTHFNSDSPAPMRSTVPGTLFC